MSKWVAPGNGFGEPNITLRRARMCRDAIARGEITLKELSNELDVEQTHFKRLLNRILTEAGEQPIGSGPQVWNSATNGRKIYRDISADNHNARRCYIGERVNKRSLADKIDEFIRTGGAITRIERQTSVAA